ncbi:MAG: DUF2231 domain-containing protein [Planctomycetota bacterium]
MQSPLHPMIVHLPMALAVLMPLLALGLLVAVQRAWLPAGVWALTVAAQALLVGSGILALRTGEHEEDKVEGIVGDAILHQHESAAQVFVAASVAVLALAVVTWFLRRGRWAPHAGLATALGTVAVLALGYRVGKAGGEIVYGHGGAAAYAPTAPGQTPAPRSHRDDDDR